MPSPSGSCSQERRQSGCQSPGQPSSLWKLPGATAITLLRLSATQCVCVGVVELHRAGGGQAERPMLAPLRVALRAVVLVPAVVERGLVLPAPGGHGERALPHAVARRRRRVGGRAVRLPVAGAAELALQAAGDRHATPAGGAAVPAPTVRTWRGGVVREDGLRAVVATVNGMFGAVRSAARAVVLVPALADGDLDLVARRRAARSCGTCRCRRRPGPAARSAGSPAASRRRSRARSGSCRAPPRSPCCGCRRSSASRGSSRTSRGRRGQVRAGCSPPPRAAFGAVVLVPASLSAALYSQLPAGTVNVPCQTSSSASKASAVASQSGCQSPGQPSSVCRLPATTTCVGVGVSDARARGQRGEEPESEDGEEGGDDGMGASERDEMRLR